VEIIPLLLLLIIPFAMWRMWRGPQGTTPARSDPGFDPAEGQREAHEARQLLIDQDWSGLSQLYGGLCPSERYHLIESLAELLQDAPPQPPEDAGSSILTLTGGVILFQGLSPAGPAGAKARGLSAQRSGYLGEAGRLLARALSESPADATALSLSLRLERATTRDRAQINSLLGRIEASGEANLYAGVNRLLAASPQEGGSLGAMWTAANEEAASGPNAAWLALPARAHIEEWRYAMAFPYGSPERADMIDRMQDDGFLRHVVRLDDMFWAAAARQPLSGAEASFAHNHFAFLMNLVKAGDRVRPHLERMGPFIGRYPWIYLPTGASRPTQLLADLQGRYGLTPQAPRKQP